ncbi:transporter family ABC domain protein (macronuclear) [Tetrahymena thermophila SB210]|uniref:Transporter family ABC domain protein n=1 Tax=Tetrahymena thermophila (strain SB210) TaxID=312017 RepID=I7MEF8_TETTS|nr:transporter family ABC domain protein [Tetrahymena thermophila SB210]EAR96275.2 transporter family ABC domain protein [Tetrahymena thermophila SB210]|eukprot:XP_001016520.2 transporter family ABC domain protein [Tetrahymena thermophila SB210]
MQQELARDIDKQSYEAEKRKNGKYSAELMNMNNSDEEHKDELFKSLNNQGHDDATNAGKSSINSQSNQNNYLNDDIHQGRSHTNNSSSPQNTLTSPQYYTENLVEKPYRVQCMMLLMHIGLLLKKNFLINQRHKLVFLFNFLTPVIVCLMLIMWQQIADRLIQFLIIEPDIYEQSLIPRCLSPEYLDSLDPTDLEIKGNKRGCITVGYHIIGEKQLWVEQAMEYVAQRNKLEFGKDVKLLSQGDPSQYQKYIRKHLNRTQIGVVFCTTSYPLKQFGYNLDIPCNINLQDSDYSQYLHVSGYDVERFKNIKTMVYTIMYNGTLNYKTPYLADPKASVGKDDLVKSLKVSLDNALIEIVAQNTIDEFSKVYDESKSRDEQRLKMDFNRERMQVVAQDYPKIPTRFTQGYDVFAGNGAFYLFVPIMVTFILLINEILREKEKRLRQGLTTMGLTHFSYITSWVLYTIITLAVLEAIMVLSGVLFEFDFFTRSPVIITFTILFSFGLSQMSIGFFITTICSDVKLGYTVAYAFLLFSVVMEMFMSTPAFIFYLYQDDPDLFVEILLKIFSLYPAFHYSKLFHDVAQRTNKHYEIAAGRWVQGPGFNYEDIFENFSGKFPYPPKEYHTPSCITSFVYLNITAILFFILGWYCDHVVSSNRGTQESPLFFLGNDYWKCLRRKQKIRRKVSASLNKFEENNQESTGINLNESVKNEREVVLKNQLEDAFVDGIRIQGISKTYYKYPFGIKSKHDKTAISDIFFEIRENELVSLLGHNGAGKSTLIGVLTGLLAPTQGTAIIRGYDIRTNMGQIRQMMGVCPQFDILWDELTAYEHLEMYCKIKNVPSKYINQEIDKRMAEVRMSDKKHYRVGTFSGGQKRRVSLAIAAIGDPKIIFLDEPTTGMDPKTRREVWNMIKEMRVNRSVILTTHAMEEADILSDRIIVVSDGRLKAIGTPLYLKNSHGDSYRLCLILNSSDPLQIEIARAQIKKLLPSSNSITSEGASIIVGVSHRHINELKQFFQIIECTDIQTLSQEELNFKNQIKEWGLSHATLEEVFLHITDHAEQFQRKK